MSAYLYVDRTCTTPTRVEFEAKPEIALNGLMDSSSLRYLLAAWGGLFAVAGRAEGVRGVGVVGDIPLRTGTGIPLAKEKEFIHKNEVMCLIFMLDITIYLEQFKKMYKIFY